MEKKFLLGTLRIVKGDASIPHSSDNRMILFLGDINGLMETDLAKKLIKRWSKVKDSFRSWYRGQVQFKLGNILPIAVQTDTEIICLLVLKDAVLDLAALKTALTSAAKYAALNKKNVHINKTEQNWSEIESMITDLFLKAGVNVTIYSPA